MNAAEHLAPMSEGLKDALRRLHLEADRALDYSVALLELTERLNNISMAFRVGMLTEDDAEEMTRSAIVVYRERMKWAGQ